jgi:hypothetical protein
MNVAPPDFTLPPFTLESVVDWRTDGDRWRAGVEWETVCGGSSSTYDECVIVGSTSGAVTGSPVPFPDPPAKEETATRATYGATPFTLYAEVDCSTPGFYEDSTDVVRAIFERTEHQQLESVFFTGTVAGVANAQYPHLAANALVTDAESGGSVVNLQLAATAVTGVATCVEVALGLLESAFADCYGGAGIVHVPNEVIPLMAEAYLLERDGEDLYTTNRNRVVAGTGYSGAAPDGTTSAGVRWIYMTPRIFGYRSDIRTFDPETTLDRSVNTVKAIAERTYVLGYDCCLVAVPVSLTCG